MMTEWNKGDHFTVGATSEWGRSAEFRTKQNQLPTAVQMFACAWKRLQTHIFVKAVVQTYFKNTVWKCFWIKLLESI